MADNPGGGTSWLEKVTAGAAAAHGSVSPQQFLDAILLIGRQIGVQTQAVQTNPPKSYAFAALPATPGIGLVVVINDSNTAVWGAAIAGGGANRVLAWWNGVAFTVIGK